MFNLRPIDLRRRGPVQNVRDATGLYLEGHPLPPYLLCSCELARNLPAG
jgi:hypothetical protein